MTLTADAYVREIEAHREAAQRALHGPTSALAAIARHDLPIGRRVRVAPDGDIALAIDRAISVEATNDGFIVDGERSGPRTIAAGRYNLRLSHQNYPALVVLDSESPRLRDDVRLRWFPVSERYRVRGRLEPDRARLEVGSTSSGPRGGDRAGWLRFLIDGVECRLALIRLDEPGFPPDHLDAYFRDATTGDESYEVGRYVAVDRDGDEVIVDFNRAYNPSCALSPYYNCPIPPPENRLAVAIRAGEMTPLGGMHA